MNSPESTRPEAGSSFKVALPDDIEGALRELAVERGVDPEVLIKDVRRYNAWVADAQARIDPLEA